FTLMIQDRGDQGPVALQAQTEAVVQAAMKNPQMASAFSAFRANVPMLKVEPDTRGCMEKGVSLQDFAETLRVYQGSLYVNDFNLFGRTWQVLVQADFPFRDEEEDIAKLKVRNSSGAMVPIGSLASIKHVNGPLVLTRYNMYPAASINGSAVPGV